MRTWKRWFICIDGKVDSSYGDKDTALDIYNWLLTSEGKDEALVSQDSEITMHYFDVDLTHRQIEDRIRSQKAFDQMLKNGLTK